MQISQKQENFPEFCSEVLKPAWNFEFFEQKGWPHKFGIFDITHSQNVAWLMSKKSRFKGSFDKEYGKRTQALLKSASQHLYHIHWSLPSQLSSKTSLWLTCEILGLLVSTLPTNEKYSLLKRDNLTIPIQMQLSKKKKLFRNFWLHLRNLDHILNI